MSEKKRGRGRPAKYKIEPINAHADEICRAVVKPAKRGKQHDDEPQVV